MATLANPRRQAAMVSNVEDAKKHGGKLQTGGYPIGEKGNFFEPTVITELDKSAAAMNTEPFGPLAIINPFKTFDDAVTEANRLPYGLAAYAWTRSAKTANAIASPLEAVSAQGRVVDLSGAGSDPDGDALSRMLAALASALAPMHRAAE